MDNGYVRLHNDGGEDNGGSKMKAEDYFQWTVASITGELKLKAEFAQQMWGAAGSRDFNKQSRADSRGSNDLCTVLIQLQPQPCTINSHIHPMASYLIKYMS